MCASVVALAIALVVALASCLPGGRATGGECRNGSAAPATTVGQGVSVSEQSPASSQAGMGSLSIRADLVQSFAVFAAALSLQLLLSKAVLCSMLVGEDLGASALCQLPLPMLALHVSTAMLLGFHTFWRKREGKPSGLASTLRQYTSLLGPLWGRSKDGRRDDNTLRTLQLYAVVAAAVHAGSMFATSFVEEEHQTVYFSVSTMHAIQLWCALRDMARVGLGTAGGRVDADRRETARTRAMAAVVLLACARLGRSYNQVRRVWGRLV